MFSICEDTEREDKNHMSKVFVALWEHCEKIEKMLISPRPRPHRRYQCRLRRRPGLRDRSRIDAGSQQESDVNNSAH